MEGIMNKFFGKTSEKTVTPTSKPKTEGAVKMEQVPKIGDQAQNEQKKEALKNLTYLMDMDGDGGLCFHALYMANSS